MEKTSRRPWLQFSLRSLLLVMLATASFFAGRVSLRHEVERAQALEAEARKAQEAAMQAEQQARYMAELARAQALFAEAMRDEAKQELTDDSAAPGN